MVRGTVQEVCGYFSATSHECAVVPENIEKLDFCSTGLSDKLTGYPISGGKALIMENVVIFDSPGKGRGLKAAKEFWAGDVIFSEASLAAVVFDRYDDSARFIGSVVEIYLNCMVFLIIFLNKCSDF